MKVPVFDEQYSWYYAGVNGWWIYMMNNIQMKQKNALKNAGHLYTIDLDKMIQYRKRYIKLKF